MGEIVCPVHYRNAWYGTAYADLIGCQQGDWLGVLLPEKCSALQTFTPLVSIAILRLGQLLPNTSDEQRIERALGGCNYQVENLPGDPEIAVRRIISILDLTRGAVTCRL